MSSNMFRRGVSGGTAARSALVWARRSSFRENLVVATVFLKTTLSAFVVASLALPASPAGADDAADGSGEILSAFFGLNDSRRIRLRTIPACQGVAGGDGMPVILSKEVDSETLDATDFRVATRSGAVGRVGCATLQPADEPGERRTVLLVGDYGSVEDQPATVDIVGDLISIGGDANFRGAKADVIPLEAGPTLVLAEQLPEAEWRFGGRGDCPRAGVTSVVRVTWTGGVTRPGGDEIGDAERRLYRVSVRRDDGAIDTVAPLAIGDLDDNDNNHELCLGADGAPLSVFFPAGHLTDPNEDLNPNTDVAVSPGAAQ